MTKCYQHILIPLDGSDLAETALEDGIAIAQLCQAQITLLQVISPLDHFPQAASDYPVYLDQIWESKKMLALQYLQHIRKRVWANGMILNLATRMGSPAETIIEYARECNADLIVMATHGRSGLQRWVYGSVADKVLHGANIPILLVRAHAKSKPVLAQNQAVAEEVF
jgi:nucleotide-binding universal stress UspA family protein